MLTGSGLRRTDKGDTGEGGGEAAAEEGGREDVWTTDTVKVASVGSTWMEVSLVEEPALLTGEAGGSFSRPGDKGWVQHLEERLPTLTGDPTAVGRSASTVIIFPA